MLFSQVLGQEHIKNHLRASVANGRVAHAQLFVGNQGVGTLPMAIAYAQLLLCFASENADTCNLKCSKLAHPDLHFTFPVTSTASVKDKPKSIDFIEDWRSFIAENPYGSLFEWLQHIGGEKKQGIINVHEAHQVMKGLKLKAFEGGFKVHIMWLPEKMNIAASNQLLKLIEEPPAKTVFILVAEQEEQVLQTIRSRCQVLHFQNLPESVIATALVEKLNIEESKAKSIAVQAQGNFNKALHIAQNDSQDTIFEQWFVTWVRSAFKAKGNAAVIHDLVQWSNEVASTTRETQKQFLQFCSETFRQALLLNYKAEPLVYFRSETGFDLSKFAPFIHSNNILEITKELEDAFYHIERNGNAKIIFTDMSIKLTRLIHAKETI